MRWIAILILIGLSGCATAPTVTSSDFCSVYEFISYSRSQDTAETRAQIDRMNAAYVCLCEKNCPKDPA